jgi:uncharacterized protein (TIGR03032 family)
VLPHDRRSPTLRSPVFTVSAPFSGDTLLYNALARASAVWRSRTVDATFLEALPEIDPARRDWDTHALGADMAPALTPTLRDRLIETLVDREDRSPDADEDLRALAGGARLALRVPLLAAAFPDARFVISFRDPGATITEMLAAWRSGRFASCPGLPDWDGPAWSLPLIPGWRELRDLSLEEIVVAQWTAITEMLLDDLEALAPERWAACDLATLLADPRAELQRLCAFLEIAYDQALLTPVETAARVLTAQATAPAPELAGHLDRTTPTASRWAELIGAPTKATPAAATSSGSSPFRSVSTLSFARLLADAQSSLLVSTYQSGKLICAREQQRLLNTHFRDFDKPMGMAVSSRRFALATRTEVWDYRDMPDVAPKIEPAGTHDACYLPRNRHHTGDALMHEMAFAGGELWVVATRFSCLATLDADHSFVPRWKPKFINSVASGDRCHLNGLAVKDDKVAFVTALGQTDEPGGWRDHKAAGGCLIDVSSSDLVCSGLSMPHSPRWHNDRLWLLESGRGELVTLDLATGKTETVVELPGFTRGLAFAGSYAFVGLSQIRESSTFGDLPLTERLRERVCGVWVVELRSGQIAGFLRFEDVVQEIFDVALLPGARYPEIAEPGSTAASESFVLP